MLAPVALELANGPPRELAVDVAESRIQSGFLVFIVVRDPPRIQALNIRARWSIALSLRVGRFQLRTVCRMAFATLLLIAGLKFTNTSPQRFFGRRARSGDHDADRPEEFACLAALAEAHHPTRRIGS